MSNNKEISNLTEKFDIPQKLTNSDLGRSRIDQSLTSLINLDRNQTGNISLPGLINDLSSNISYIGINRSNRGELDRELNFTFADYDHQIHNLIFSYYGKNLRRMGNDSLTDANLHYVSKSILMSADNSFNKNTNLKSIFKYDNFFFKLKMALKFYGDILYSGNDDLFPLLKPITNSSFDFAVLKKIHIRNRDVDGYNGIFTMRNLNRFTNLEQNINDSETNNFHSNEYKLESIHNLIKYYSSIRNKDVLNSYIFNRRNHQIQNMHEESKNFHSDIRKFFIINVPQYIVPLQKDECSSWTINNGFTEVIKLMRNLNTNK